jgi:hypothetical protein
MRLAGEQAVRGDPRLGPASIVLATSRVRKWPSIVLRQMAVTAPKRLATAFAAARWEQTVSSKH